MGVALPFIPIIMRLPGSAHPHPGKGDKGWSRPITSQIPDLGVKEWLRLRPGGTEEMKWAGAPTEKKAFGGPGQMRNYKLCRRKEVSSYFPISK